MNTPNAYASRPPRQPRHERAAVPDPRQLDRLPPHSPVAEAGVLGCLMLSPRECLGECLGKFGGRRDVFYDLRHQVIFNRAAAMYDANEAIDLITLQQRLQDQKELEQVGGNAFLATLADGVPSAANLSYYLDILWEKYLLRTVVRTCTEAVTRVYEHEGDVEQLLDEIERDILHIGESRSTTQGRDMYALVDATMAQIEAMRRGVGMLSGLRTHLGHLDKWTGGLQRQELIVLAARPSVGKTALALSVARNIALLEKLPVGIFSMEMSGPALTLRLLCTEAEVDSNKIRTGFASHEDDRRLTSIAPKIGAAKIHIDDTPALGILDLRARARRMVHQLGVQLLVVDYLQLMHGSKDYRGDRVREVAEISGGLKSLAKELNVPVLVLSQLNRELERAKNRKPQLADLRESGAIEQDADVVLMLYRPKGENHDDEESDVVRVNALIAKQRNGPSDWDVELTFTKSITKFADAYQNRGKELPTRAELGISGAAQPATTNGH